MGLDAEQTESIAAYLDGFGEQSCELTAASPAEAERIAEREQLTCVIAQYDLPEGDGLSALTRCLAAQPDLLTILVSRHDEESLIDRTYEAGVDEFVHYTGPEKGRVVEHHLSTYLGEAEDGASPPRTSRYLETLASTTSDAIVSVDESSTIRYANPAVAEVFGYDPSEVVGEPLTMLMPEGLTDDHRAGVRRYLETGERTLDWDDIELPGRHKAGHHIPLSISFSEFSVGEERYFTGIIRDIRDRRRLQSERDLYHDATQQILKADSFHEGLRIAVDAIGEAMDWRYGEAWVCPDGEHLERVPDPYVTSPETETFAEATDDVTFHLNEGSVGRVWQSGESEWLTDVATDDAPFFRSAAATEAGLHAALGVPIVSDGTVVAVMVFLLAEPREPDETMVDATRTIAADLGRLMERLEAETALREERNLNERILETSPVGIAILERDGTFSYVNDRATEILHVGEYDPPLTAADLDLQMVSFDGEPVDTSGNPYRRVVESTESVSGELRIETDDGPRWLAVDGAPLDHEAGEGSAMVFSLQDVTQRKLRERRLQQHEVVMNTVSDGLYALDGEGRFVVVNDAYCRLIGYDREELVGRPASEFVESRLIEEARALQEQIRRGGDDEATMELTLTTASGEQVPIEARITLFEYEKASTGEPGSSATSATASAARSDSLASTRSGRR
ncbi:PAS domain S-box protein [Halomarina salina]|uniref:PAS domain S-box protein n=1 Tax=Halomarina salina TaxID=1872699 RepID=A0ABD5RML9_9EURY